MFTKHFFKTVCLFLLIIGLGLLGIVLVNHFFPEEQNQSPVDIAE